MPKMIPITVRNRSRLGIGEAFGALAHIPAKWPPVRRQGYAPNQRRSGKPLRHFQGAGKRTWICAKSTPEWQAVTALSRRRQADLETARPVRARRDRRVAAV